MPDYRAFIVGEDGHVKGRIDLRCKTEAEAKEQAKQLSEMWPVEVWDGPTQPASIQKLKGCRSAF